MLPIMRQPQLTLQQHAPLVHRESVPYFCDLHNIPSCDFCRVRNRSIIHFTFDGQLVGEPPEDERCASWNDSSGDRGGKCHRNKYATPRHSGTSSIISPFGAKNSGCPNASTTPR